MFRYLLFLSLFCLPACNATRQLTTTNELTQLQQAMTGMFDSSAQAAADTTYFDISLQMYPIWQQSDGYWLYVEQAVTQALDRPYRQRIYELQQLGENKFVSKVYTLEQPERFIGKAQQPDFFDQFGQEILSERAGCGVYLTKQKTIYIGGTRAKECGSQLRGATYATSEVTISADRIVSWDRGFAADDSQVWGATESGYIFIKKVNPN